MKLFHGISAFRNAAVVLLFLAGSMFGNCCLRGATGIASWYGEENRGRLMANGHKFDPDKFTAASWFYPLGTKVKVTTKDDKARVRTVVVTVTDRGPAKDLVRDGRIIDLGHAAFEKLCKPDLGLVQVTVQPVRKAKTESQRLPAPLRVIDSRAANQSSLVTVASR